MPKRAIAEVEQELVERPSKRQRPNHPDRLSILSDELILRTLSFLPLHYLTLCERVSQRLRGLATDGQIWKAIYYDRFVRPRAARLPSVRAGGEAGAALNFSSKVARWLEDEKLVRSGLTTDWKKQYKLRHNWQRGSAQLSETQVAEKPSSPPLLVRLHKDVIVIVDREHGLRAWTLGKDCRFLASCPLGDLSDTSSPAPVSLAIDTNSTRPQFLSMVVGFGNGSFSVYRLHRLDAKVEHGYTHPASSAGEVAAVAFTSPFLLTITPEPRLSLYKFPSGQKPGNSVVAPLLLSSMRSHTAYAPMSLHLRMSASTLLASIAFAMPSYLPRWTVGIQELRLDSEGSVVDSRVSFAARPHQQPLSSIAHPDMLSILPLPSSRPASLSYNHPYLLTAHPDNTLTLYMVTSNASTLDISSGTILWGHTSSISGAQVGDRGKAVSVSTRGNELRVWELEGRGITSSSKRKSPAVDYAASVRVVAQAKGSETAPARKADDPNKPRSDVSLLKPSNVSPTSPAVSDVTKGWVAFDDERVVLLREKQTGKQAVVVYDFT